MDSWFSTSFRYSGEAEVTFADPQGTIRGTALAIMGERQDRHVQVVVEEIETNPPLRFGALELLYPERRKATGTQQAYIPRFRAPNRITSLTVRTPEGRFSASEKISIQSPNVISVGKGPNVVCFSLLSSQFDSEDAGPAIYWVMPLTNYVAQRPHGKREFGSHPIRLSSPHILAAPDPLPECAHEVEAWHGVIPFSFQGMSGFIQPVSDYVERVDRLQQGLSSHEVTAVMIGHVGDNSTGTADALEWLPFAYLDLLGLASGSEVSTSWVEFRDVERRLVRRIHVPMQGTAYSKAMFVPIRDSINNGTGVLLSDAPSSPYWGDPRLRVVVGYILRSNATVLVEDRFLDLARAFDGLFRLLSLDVPPLLSQLRPEYAKKVKEVFRTAESDLMKFAGHLAARMEASEAEVVKGIAARVQGFGGKSGAFGETVLTVLDHFGFPDGKIVQHHLAQHPHPDNLGWSQLLSVYRNRSAHGLYFELQASKHQLEDIFRLSNHMLDILLRSVFRLLQYTGTYNPPVLLHRADERINWVTTSTSAEQLGYHSVSAGS